MTVNKQRVKDAEKDQRILMFATGSVAEAIRKGLPKQRAILAARESLVNTLGVTRNKAERACWQAYADIEKNPTNASFHLHGSSKNLLFVEMAGYPKIAITIADFIRLINPCVIPSNEIDVVTLH